MVRKKIWIKTNLNFKKTCLTLNKVVEKGKLKKLAKTLYKFLFRPRFRELMGNIKNCSNRSLLP